MKIEQQIEQELKNEIKNAGLTITDPRELSAWMSKNKVGRSAMSAATGAEYNSVVAKLRAAVRDMDETEYAELSKPLSQENYPGKSTNWEDWKPQHLIVSRLVQALEDTVFVLYAGLLGRWPDEKGRAHYTTQLANDRPLWKIVREIEMSSEAQKLKEVQ